MMIPTRLIYTPINIKLIGVIPIDVFEKETYTRKAKVTDYPIENGSTISDNLINYPTQIEIDGIVGPGDALSFFNLGALGTSFADVFYAINALIDAKVPIIIVMGLATYTNMVITDFVVNRDKQTSQGFPFHLAAKEIVIIKSQILTVPNSQINGGQAEGPVNFGVQNSSAANDGFDYGAAGYNVGSGVESAQQALGSQAVNVVGVGI